MVEQSAGVIPLHVGRLVMWPPCSVCNPDNGKRKTNKSTESTHETVTEMAQHLLLSLTAETSTIKD